MFDIYCKDNNQGKSISGCMNGFSDLNEVEQNLITNSLDKISNKKIKELQYDSPDLLIFPKDLGKYHDDIGKNQIIGLNNERVINTYNLMGFIGVDNVRLTIGSRFDQHQSKQFFLQYMLQKVFAINLFNLETTIDNKENIWDFLLFYIFPYYLNKALRQGVFKQYVRRQYNDFNIKGSVVIARHIRQNIPFMGKVAYNTREYSYDNPVTQLIRHTIEYIQATKFSNALSQNTETVDNVRLIQQLTPSYTLRDRQKVLAQNYRPNNHPYFTEYESLRKICLQILRFEGLAIRESSEKVYGLLFDGAWLWEEYLKSILKNLNFKHPENTTGKGKVKLFKNSGKNIYPDFYKADVVIDAKYKHLEKEKSEEVTGDYYQVITYMYRLKATTGVLLYPKEIEEEIGVFSMHKESYGGGEEKAKFIKYGMKIPQNGNTFKEFIDEMRKSENKLKEQSFVDEKEHA